MKKIVSFDVFDTLITRCCESDSYVFTLTAKLANKNGLDIDEAVFVRDRTSAEKICRSKCPGSEITIAQIYAQLSLMDKRYSSLSARFECEAEKSVCFANRQGLALYNNALKNDSTIIAISDMYLPLEVVQEILVCAGYTNIKRVFVSSECSLTKATGALYKKVQNDLSCSNESFVHIGDNFYSDFLVPRKLGIESRWLFNGRTYKGSRAYHKKFVDKFISSNKDTFKDISSAAIASNDYESIGYAILGPVLLGFCEWLHQEGRKEGINQYLFVARDGLIIKKCFDYLYPECETKYLFGSRRVFFVPTLGLFDDFEAALASMSLPATFTVSNFLSRFGVDDLADIEAKTGGKYSANYLLDDKKHDNLFEIYNFYSDYIMRNSIEEFRCLSGYFNATISPGKKYAFVDIGWNGNMQANFVRLLNEMDLQADIFGFYVALRPSSSNIQNYSMRGFLFESRGQQHLSDEEKLYNSIFEAMFTAPHGSIKRICFDGHDYYPVCAEYEYEGKDRPLREIQDGAILYVQDAVKRKLSVNRVFCMHNIRNVGLNPSLEMATLFGNLPFFDNELSHLANPMRSRKYYATHPRTFIAELSKSTWKPGWLRRVFGTHINFGRIISSL